MAHNNDSLLVDAALLGQAEQLCKRRLESDPENRTVLRALAEVQRKRGNLSEAAAVYERLFSLEPHDHEAGYLAAVFSGREWLAPPEGIRAAPFVLLRNFLPPQLHEPLLPFLISARDQFVPFTPDPTAPYHPDSRATLQFRGKWERRRFEAALAAVLPDVIPRLYLPPFLVGPVELVVRAYQDGHFFGVHRDAPPGSRYSRRVVNFVYYLHKQPRPYEGGELLLFDSDPEADTLTKSRFTRVVPEDNCVIFFPPNFYHSVLPVRCPSKELADSRFVINGHILAGAGPDVGAREPAEDARAAAR